MTWTVRWFTWDFTQSEYRPATSQPE